MAAAVVAVSAREAAGRISEAVASAAVVSEVAAPESVAELQVAVSGVCPVVPVAFPAVQLGAATCRWDGHTQDFARHRDPTQDLPLEISAG
ncbi:MAG: hypothetical protein WBW99_12265 [Pseudolabrys sp.]